MWLTNLVWLVRAVLYSPAGDDGAQQALAADPEKQDSSHRQPVVRVMMGDVPSNGKA